jgi:hypothetical protein
MIPPKAPKVCERCGVTYIPASKRQKYCKECRKVLQKEWARKYEKKRREARKKPVKENPVQQPVLTLAQAVKEARGERHDLWAVHFMEVLLTDRGRGGRRKLATSFSQERMRDSLLSLGEKHQIR